jgi:hypothetical protein
MDDLRSELALRHRLHQHGGVDIDLIKQLAFKGSADMIDGLP